MCYEEDVEMSYCWMLLTLIFCLLCNAATALPLLNRNNSHSRLVTSSSTSSLQPEARKRREYSDVQPSYISGGENQHLTLAIWPNKSVTLEETRCKYCKVVMTLIQEEANRHTIMFKNATKESQDKTGRYHIKGYGYDDDIRLFLCVTTSLKIIAHERKEDTKDKTCIIHSKLLQNNKDHLYININRTKYYFCVPNKTLTLQRNKRSRCLFLINKRYKVNNTKSNIPFPEVRTTDKSQTAKEFNSSFCKKLHYWKKCRKHKKSQSRNGEAKDSCDKEKKCQPYLKDICAAKWGWFKKRRRQCKKSAKQHKKCKNLHHWRKRCRNHFPNCVKLLSNCDVTRRRKQQRRKQLPWRPFDTRFKNRRHRRRRGGFVPE